MCTKDTCNPNIQLKPNLLPTHVTCDVESSLIRQITRKVTYVLQMASKVSACRYSKSFTWSLRNILSLIQQNWWNHENSFTLLYPYAICALQYASYSKLLQRS